MIITTCYVTIGKYSNVIDKYGLIESCMYHVLLLSECSNYHPHCITASSVATQAAN